MFYLFTPLFTPLLPFADSTCKTRIFNMGTNISDLSQFSPFTDEENSSKNCYALGFESESIALPITSSVIPMSVRHDFEICSVRDYFLRLYGMQLFSSQMEAE